LIVFAPGFAVGPTPYESLLEAWASHGYVVAAIEFPLTDAAVAGPDLDENDIVNQPADVRFVTDSLVAPGSPLASYILTNDVAIAGHSDGAETALAAATRPVPLGEPTFKAVLFMSGQPIDGSVPTHNPPILVTQGTADTINPAGRGLAAFALAASPKYLLTLEGAGHLPPLISGSRFYGVVVRVTETFFDSYLRTGGAGAARATLEAQVAGDPSLARLTAD
jgi:pimeloyl-ACP methyl ester carboxylesterase